MVFFQFVVKFFTQLLFVINGEFSATVACPEKDE
jgi:hypothetical protein